MVALHPERLAIKDRNSSYSYAALNEFSNQIAAVLNQRKDLVKAPVVIFLDQGSSFIATIFGVLKSGNYYVPLDPDFPFDRNSLVIKDAGARLLLADDSTMAQAAELGDGQLEIVNIDTIDQSISKQNPTPDTSPDDLAYIIYTSGSTGNPKGIPQNQRNLLHGCMRRTNIQKITPDDRLTMLYSCSVMGSVYGIFGALLNGASLFPYNIKKYGLAGLEEWLLKEEITVYHSVSSVFRHFIPIIKGSTLFPSIRLLIFGGERVPYKNITMAWKHFSEHMVILTGLGSTETGTVRYFVINCETQIENQIVPIGYPVEDMEVLLLDENEQPVPHGEIGEICIKSRYIANQYWNLPELSKKVFKVFEDQENQILYKSGDLGLLTNDNLLIHKGRKDNQVKINGFRIELSEIELALMKHEAVKEAVVAIKENKNQEPQLTAYFCSETGDNIPVMDLRSYLKVQVPVYMLPTQFVQLASFPTTPNGKIDRKALTSLDTGNLNGTEKSMEGLTDMEEHILKIWSTVLGVKEISIHDNFFELGGNSLLAARMLAEVETISQKRIPMAVLFTHNTIRKLGSIVSSISMDKNWSSLVAVNVTGKNQPFYCIHGVGGNILNYQPLAESLGNEHPFYGLQAKGLNGQETPLFTIEEMATHYMEEIIEHNPEGPYFIGGSSFGGRVAFELASQLRQKGKEVGLVALLDTSVVYTHEDIALGEKLISNELNSWLRRVSYHINDFFATENSKKIKFISQKIKTIQRRQKNKNWQKKYQEHINQEGTIPLHLQDVKQACYQASKKYNMKPYDGKIHLFRAKDRGFMIIKDYDLGWSKFALGGVRVIDVPGTHTSILENPHVEFLAQQIKACIAEYIS